MSPEQILARAKSKYMQDNMHSRKQKLTALWAKHQAAFSDYLHGMTVYEIMDKHHIAQRTEVYHLMKTYGIPLIPTKQAAIIARRISNRNKTDEARFKVLSHCKCVNCIWIKDRLELIKRKNVEWGI